MTAVALRAGRAGDWPGVRQLLESAGLPHEDLGAAAMPDFVVAADGDLVVGAIGLEASGSIGLLRSLVVAAGQRGNGLGRRLVAELESLAIARGLEELWLLTIDAGGFFEQAGYVRRRRDETPAPIAASREFTALCPASAFLYSRRLQDDCVRSRSQITSRPFSARASLRATTNRRSDRRFR